MFDRIAVRSVPEDVIKGLNALAARHDRSVEAEARFALRSWVEPILRREEQSARRAEVSGRLRDVLLHVNKVRRGTALRPSHIALEIGEDHAEPVEKWFTGELEPSFRQLDAVAGFLGCESAWLQHGDKQPFPVNHARIPENPTEGVKWLLDIEDVTQNVDHLRLVRSGNQFGSLAVVKQYGEWRCRTYYTPYHISEEIGGGGEGSLASLSVILNLLYKYYVRRGKTGLIVSSYVIPNSSFDTLISGRVQALTVLRDAPKQPWWEDFWNADQFRKERSTAYWPGWQALCERIYNVVEQTSFLRQARDLIDLEKHPLLTGADDE